MKKVSVWKYITNVAIFVMSFFVFSHLVIRADNIAIKDHLYFELEADGDYYSIAGVSNDCSDDECLNSISTIDELTIPNSYNGKNITSIKDGSGSSVISGLKDFSINKIIIGDNVSVIGSYAFYGFSGLKEISLSNSVSEIKENSFANSSIENIYWNNKDDVVIGNDAFSNMESLKRVVFNSKSLANAYKNSCSELGSDILSLFTYEVLYIYHSDNETCGSNNCIKQKYYGDDVITSLPSIDDLDGFSFVKWKSRDSLVDVTVGDVVSSDTYEYHVIPVWELKSPEVSIKSYFEDELVSNNTITYAGKDKYLELRVGVSHHFITDPNFTVTYKWAKRTSITSNLTEISNVYKINRVKQSATYICTVTVSYPLYESKSVTVEINATIQTKDLLINVNDNEIEYGVYASAGNVDGSYYSIDTSTSLVESESIKNFDVKTYNNGNIGKGFYENVLKMEILNIGYDGDDTNYLSEYNIVYNYGDLTVKQKVLDIALNDYIKFSYGESINLTKNVFDTVYDGAYSNSIIVTYVSDVVTGDDVGEYDISNVVTDDSNYIVSLNNLSEYNKVVIEPKEVEVVWNIDSNLTYSNSLKSVSASYVDINGNDVVLTINVNKNGVISEFKNAGDYEVSVVLGTVDTNYTLTNSTKNITIERASSEIIGDRKQTKVYTGKAQKVDVRLNHSEGTLIQSGYESCINAQSLSQSPCYINVYSSQTENYESVIETFELKIARKSLVVTPMEFEVKYGVALSLKQEVDGVNGEKITVFFTKASGSSELNVGYYDIGGVYVNDVNGNYSVSLANGSGVNKIKIVPAEVEIQFFYYSGLVYDGKVKEIAYRVYGADESKLGIIEDYNGKPVIKNAGDYKISISLANSNYCIKGNNYIEFSIAKAKYDMSKIKLSDYTSTFDFKNHFITLEGDLPSGVYPVYEIDGNSGNGTSLPFKHTVKVSFIGDFENYEYIEPMEATLNIKGTWLVITLSILFAGIVAGVVLLVIFVKKGKIRFSHIVQKIKIMRVIKKNKALMEVNKILESNKEKSKQDEEEIVFDDDVKFVKNRVVEKPKSIISMSFVDELYRSDQDTKQYYSDIKNELLSYDGVVSKIKRDYETFYYNNIPIARMDVVGGILQAYFALDPNQYDSNEYKHKDVSKEKENAAIPLLIIVKSFEDLRNAKMFVRIIRRKEKLKSVSNFVRTDYVKIYTAKEGTFSVFKKNFVKKGSKESEED